jgi:hypothetical protein
MKFYAFEKALYPHPHQNWSGKTGIKALRDEME